MSWNKFLIFVAVLCAIVYIVRMSQANLGSAPPFLDVVAPLENTVVTSTSVHVSGHANVPYVTIHGVKVPTKDATFEYEFQRSNGTGVMDVTAENNMGSVRREVNIVWVE